MSTVDKLSVSILALERIIDPIYYIKQTVTNYNKFSAEELANNPEYLKEIAKKALSQIQGN